MEEYNSGGHEVDMRGGGVLPQISLREDISDV